MIYQTYLVFVQIICSIVIVICDFQVNLDGLGTLIGSTTHTWITQKTIYQYLGIRYGRSTGGRRRYKVSVHLKEILCLRLLNPMII